MDFKWSMQLGNGLRPNDDEERLYETYHVASRVVPEVSRLAPPTSTNPFEMFVASRGFTQLDHLPAVALSDREPADAGLREVMLRRRSSRVLSEPVAFAEVSGLMRQALGLTSLVENEAFGVAQGLRAWPSAGGLYPLDAYLVASKVDDLAEGIYHFNVAREQLERLPTRGPRDVLAEGFLWQDFVTDAACVVLLVGVFERTIVKYGERGYRLILLDAGHAAQNLLLTCEQLGLPAIALGGFADEALARDLRIDGVSRAVVHAVAVGGRAAASR
jgi:SagB-type dehydrogenase family enzyme